MARQEYLDILKQGVDAWNEWREEHLEELEDIQLDLSEADFNGENLEEANFENVNLNPHSAVWKKIFLNKSETLSSMHVLPVLFDTDYRRIFMYIK
jgi:hypothetical protein